MEGRGQSRGPFPGYMDSSTRVLILSIKSNPETKERPFLRKASIKAKKEEVHKPSSPEGAGLAS